MDEIERKTIQDIKDYVKSLDTPDNEVYQQNSLLIMSCFSKAIEFIEQNAKLRQPLVMGSLVKSLNWIDSPEKRSGDIYKVMSRADVAMPHTVGNACIEITEQTYPHKYYEAKLWCFNRGTYMVEGKSVDDAKSNAFKWWSDFVCGFLNCP